MLPSTTSEELSEAIIETVKAGADIINLSIGLSESRLTKDNKLQQAYDYALKHDVILVAASGNRADAGNSLLEHNWIIPVAAADESGVLAASSNLGRSIGTRGFMAPGVNVLSTSPGGQHVRMSGTSVAAPFVTGTVALLKSIFPQAPSTYIIHSMINAATSNHRRHSITPPLLNAEGARNILRSIYQKLH